MPTKTSNKQGEEITACEITGRTSKLLEVPGANRNRPSGKIHPDSLLCNCESKEDNRSFYTSFADKGTHFCMDKPISSYFLTCRAITT